MEQVGQLIIPQAKKVDKVKKQRKPSVPQVRRFRPIKKFEIIHRPFDIKFRGRLNKWLNYLRDQKGFSYKTGLNDNQKKIIGLYLFPQTSKKRWLTQKQVLQKSNLSSKPRFRDQAVRALIVIWEEAKKHGI